MIKIRRAVEKEIPILIDFQQKMAFETESLTLDPVLLTQGVKAVFHDSDKGFYLVAEMDGMVVGCTMITPEWSDWRNGTFLWIQSVYVKPEYRKKGVFSMLYTYVKEMVLNSPDYLGLRLYVVNENIVAQKTYFRCGMDGGHYKLYEWIK